MQRKVKSTLFVILAVIMVLVLISPACLGATFFKIQTEGLKSVSIRADIYKAPDHQGPKHGRIQILVREVEPQLYSYKFQIHMRKVQPNTEFTMRMWCELDNIELTIYGEQGSFFRFLEMFANMLGIDSDGMGDEGLGNGKITTTLADLQMLDEVYEITAPQTFITDERGSYKNIKSGLMNEDALMEYLFYMLYPRFREMLMDMDDRIWLEPEADLSDLGIIGLCIYGNTYTFTLGAEFEAAQGQCYATEDIVCTHTMNDFLWGETW
jgi:hypothetical protein